MWKKIDSIFCCASCGSSTEVSRAHHICPATRLIQSVRTLQLANLLAFHSDFFTPGNYFKHVFKNVDSRQIAYTKILSLYIDNLFTLHNMPDIKLMIHSRKIVTHHCPKMEKKPSKYDPIDALLIK